MSDNLNVRDKEETVEIDHPAFPPDLDVNDFDYFLESNKPLKSGVYKAKNFQKDVREASCNVSFNREVPKIF